MRLLAAALCLLTGLAAPAIACMGPGLEDHHYPSCAIPQPDQGMRVTVIQAAGHSLLSSVHLGYGKGRARLINIEVVPTDVKHYLVLSSHHQVIWNLTGATDTIAQLIVLGATKHGPDAAGVIGIPPEKIVFTNPDLSLLDAAPNTSCTRVFQACTPGQWFDDRVDRRITFYPAPSQRRLQADEIMPTLSLRGLREHPHFLFDPDISHGTLVQVDPALVVSPNPAKPYQHLPGQPGLDALVKSGALVPAGTELHTQVTKAYGEAFSARYQSRFDPEFSFVPTVDYIITRPVTLPPELPPMRFLLASGVPLPDLAGELTTRNCFYRADDAGLPAPKRDWKSPFCREHPTGAHKPDQDILRAAQLADQAQKAAVCQPRPLSDDTHVAAVALSEGDRRRYRKDPERQVDIEVRHTGPVALYLSIEGGPVHWNITGENIAAVFMPETKEFGMHRLTLNGAPADHIPFSERSETCDWWPPQFANRLGPSIAHLEERMIALTGQGIDRLITHTDTGQPWLTPGAPAPRYVID